MSKPQKVDYERRTLKVTLLSSEWRSSTDGNFSTIVRELAIQLAKFPKLDVFVLLPKCNREDRSSAESHNVKLMEADGVPGVEPVLWLSSPPRNHTMDCIVGHGVHLGRVIPFIKRNPYYSHCKWIQVVHFAPEEDGKLKGISESEQMQEAEIQLCKMADQVITIGPSLAEAYKHYLRTVNQEENVFHLTPGIFSEFLEVEQATKERRTFDILVIGSGNSFEDFNVKGYNIAAKAIAELKDESYKLKFVQGTGRKGDVEAKKLLHHGINCNQLIFCSFDDSRKVLADLFCEVDLAIMPSRTEDFGITALEALSAGLPVLVSGNSGLGEALKKVPLGSHSVVHSEDPKVWAKKIKGIRQKKRGVRLSVSKFLREKYLEKYNWEESCKRLVRKMENLVFGGSEQVICNLQQWQQNVSRWKISSNADPLSDLKKIASEKGYRILANLQTRNCMFYALSEQLEIVKGVKIHHFELRHSLVQYLREHPKLVDGTDLFHFVDGHATWRGYLTDMEQYGTLGDHLILWAAANCYHIAIHVISSLPGQREVIIMPSFPFDQSKHLVLGHVHEGYYVSLQPLQVTGRSKSRAKSKQCPVKRSSSGVHKFTAKNLKVERVTLPSTSTKETTHFKERLQQRERESMLIEQDDLVPMEVVMSPLIDVKMEPDTVQHLEGIARFFIFRGEVTEKGSVWNLPEAAAYITFHEGAVPKPLLFTCSVLPPKLRSPPISSDELLVSNVVEMSHDGPPDLEFRGDDDGNVTVALLHSASDLKGYEVVIKQLVDLHNNEWKDLKTWHASEKPEVSEWPQLVEATCTLTQCSSFAAIWRLKSFTFTRCTSAAPQFTCVVPDFPDILVEVPLSSVPVDQDFTLTIKVQEFPSNEVEDIGILCGSFIHISSSRNIVHVEPVTIKVPLALRESKHDFSELSNEVIRISYLDSEGKPWNASWTDITGQLEGPITVKDGIVEFKVKLFCRFCVCVFNKPVPLLEDYFRRLFSRTMPQSVHFLTCLCKTTIPDTYGLLLYCYPNFKQPEVEKKLSSYDIPYKGKGRSKEPVCVGDEIVVTPIAFDFVLESQRNEKVVLRFLGNDISDNRDRALIVRLDGESVATVKFFKDKELQKLLCEVPILKTPTASAVPVTVGVDQRVLEEKPACVGLESSDSESSSLETDDLVSISDWSSDTARDTEEESFGFIKEKPIPAKQKEGAVTDDDSLQTLGKAFFSKWDRLARRLPGITEDDREEIVVDHKILFQRGFCMLKLWKKINGEAADYKTLHDALVHKMVQRKDLAEKYCFE